MPFMADIISMNDMVIIEVKQTVLGGLQSKIDKLNLRAKRLHVTPVTLQQLTSWTPRFEMRSVSKDYFCPAKREQVHVGDFANFGITIEKPRLQGWSFIATIEHAGTAGNMIHKCPTPEGTPEIDLTPFRTGPAKCDHCQTPRNRKDTYVILHEDGRMMQIGKDCLCDVVGLGATPESIANWAAWMSTLSSLGGWTGEGEGDYDDSGEGYGARDSYVTTKTFVAYAVAVIAAQGFVSRKNAGLEDRKSATVDDVWFNMEPPRGLTPKQRAELIKPTEDDFAKAEMILVWAKQIDPRSDFDHNLRCLASQDMMDRRNGGLAAYLPVAYARAIEKEIERKAKAAASPSKHVGEIGKRIKGAKLTYVSTPWSGETDYGMRYIHRFVTEDGSQIVWKTGNEVTVAQGTVLKADFTPKTHADFNGIPQTEVLRVKLEEIA